MVTSRGGQGGGGGEGARGWGAGIWDLGCGMWDSGSGIWECMGVLESMGGMGNWRERAGSVYAWAIGW